MRRTNGKKPKNPVNYGVWLLGIAPKSVLEMKKALARKGFTDEEIEPVIEKLLDWGYLNDAQYKQYFIRSHKSQNTKGRYWIKRELMARGIDDVDDLEDLYPDEEECEYIEHLLSRWHKLGTEIPKDKYYRRLATRGFNQGNIFACIEDLQQRNREFVDDDDDFEYFPL